MRSPTRPIGPSWIAAALTVLFGALLTGCATARSGPQRHEFTRVAMGVQTRIVVYAADDASAEAGAAAGFAEIARLEQIFSDYRPTSESSALAQAAGGPPVLISDDLAEVLRTAREISLQSAGAFDVTIGPASRLWRQTRTNRTIPSQEELERARSLVDFQAVELSDPDARPQTARLARPGMALDFGGILKGHAAQRARDVLAQRGLPQAMVSLAGDIAIGDPPPGKAGWTILAGPDHAPGRSGPPAPRLVLHNTCISTSGDAGQFVEIDGQRYSHIVHPRTALGTSGGVEITVVHPEGAWADALATAAIVLAPGDARPFLRMHAVKAVVREGKNGRPELLDGQGPMRFERSPDGARPRTDR